jgi:hypothetical protein
MEGRQSPKRRVKEKEKGTIDLELLCCVSMICFMLSQIKVFICCFQIIIMSVL